MLSDGAAPPRRHNQEIRVCAPKVDDIVSNDIGVQHKTLATEDPAEAPEELGELHADSIWRT
jgi:hypothetical protein